MLFGYFKKQNTFIFDRINNLNANYKKLFFKALYVSVVGAAELCKSLNNLFSWLTVTSL